MDVVAIGELLIDFTYKSADAEGYPTMEAHPGGAPANFLAALNQYGCETAMLGKVGNDAFGQMLIRTMEKAGIETKGIIVSDDVFTTLAFVTLDEQGDREFSFARKPGADTQIRFEELDLSLVDDAKVLHFGTLSLTNEPARTATYKLVEYAKNHGKLITYDPNLRKPLWKSMDDAKDQMLWGLHHADIVKISDEEAKFLFDLTPEAAAVYILENYNVKLVFVTCGADGCCFQNKKCYGHVPGLTRLDIVDTTGAGDIFGGSAVSQLLKCNKAPENLCEDELRQIVGFACAAAGLSTTRPGGISSVPTLEAVIERMQSL